MKNDKYIAILNKDTFLDTVEKGIVECINNLCISNEYNKIYAFLIVTDFGNGNIWFEIIADDQETIELAHELNNQFNFNNKQDISAFLDQYSGLQVDEEYAPIFNTTYYADKRLHDKFREVFDIMFQDINNNDTELDIVMNQFEEYIHNELRLILEKLKVNNNFVCHHFDNNLLLIVRSHS